MRNRIVWVFAIAAMLTLTPLQAGAVNQFDGIWDYWDGQGYQVFGPTFDPCADKDWEDGRTVRYYDKARMELPDPSVDPSVDPNPWLVPMGRLVAEMVTGSMQIGSATYQQRLASWHPVAGDPFQTDGAITYGWFAPLYSVNGYPVDGVFQHYLDNLFGSDNWLQFMGHPISPPEMWFDVRVGGQVRPVMIQLFERRALTYTPSNPPGWQVEFGNVGQHYCYWRYYADEAYIPSFAVVGHDDSYTWNGLTRRASDNGPVSFSVGELVWGYVDYNYDGIVDHEVLCPAWADRTGQVIDGVVNPWRAEVSLCSF